MFGVQKASSSEVKQSNPKPSSAQSTGRGTQRFIGEQTLVIVDSVSPGTSKPLTRLQGGAVSQGVAQEDCSAGSLVGGEDLIAASALCGGGWGWWSALGNNQLGARRKKRYT